VLDADVVADVVGGRTVPVPVAAARAAMQIGFALRLQRSEAGWLDMGRRTPLMDSGRAARLLGWTARHGAVDAFRELLAGLAEGAGTQTAPLHPRAHGRLVELTA
jgi:hypothetical protein